MKHLWLSTPDIGIDEAPLAIYPDIGIDGVSLAIYP